MGVLTFSINVTLDGCVDHEMTESRLPAVARGDQEAPPAMRELAVKLEARPKYGVSSMRKDSRGSTVS